MQSQYNYLTDRNFKRGVKPKALKHTEAIQDHSNKRNPEIDRISREYLLTILDYDPETGCCTNKITGRYPKHRTELINEYLKVSVTLPESTVKVSIPVHRIAWLIMTGSFPPDGLHIDHKNQIKHDNRWSNLRLLTHSDNLMNRDKASSNNSSTGIIGVSLTKQGKYHAYIHINKKRVNIGFFDTVEEAAEARRLKKLEVYPHL